MKLSNLKTALSGLARKPESTLVISPSLSLHVGSIDTSNTQYLQRQTEFLRNNPINNGSEFFARLWRREVSGDIVQYLAHVVITGWELLDDDGKPQDFSTAECVELLTLADGIGASITVAVIDHAVTQTNYALNWESVVTKNS
jgi:hypothetical protein